LRPSSKFEILSLCSGGTSAAAALGAADRLFQRHRAWRSDKVRNNYIEKSLASFPLLG